MSVISTGQTVAALKKGSSWGTEADITSGGMFFKASSISPSGGFADFIPRDFGTAGKRTSQARLQGDFTCKIVTDLTYGQPWLALLAGHLGTESTPAEQTPSQTDYLVTMDLADDVFGTYWTLVYTIETDRVIVLPSLKIIGVTIEVAPNQAGTVTFDAIMDTIAESSANTAAEINAITALNYETATLGGTNHYFRSNVDTGAGLSSGDDKAIAGFTMSLTRTHKTRFGLRGANTKYTMEPKQVGDIEGTVTITHSELDNATYDMWTEWASVPYRKAELFMDGSIIGSTVNRSFKWQFPYLQSVGALPGGHDIPNNNSLFNPSITYRMLKRSAAPTGMTGVTDYLRFTEIHPTRSTKWTA